MQVFTASTFYAAFSGCFIRILRAAGAAFNRWQGCQVISVVTLPVPLSHLTEIVTVNGQDVQVPLVDSEGHYLNLPASKSL